MPLSAAWKDAAAPDIGRKAVDAASAASIRRTCNNAMVAMIRSASDAGAESAAVLHRAKRTQFARIVYDLSLSFDQTTRRIDLVGGNTDAEDVYFALMAMYDAVFEIIATMRGTPASFIPHAVWEPQGPDSLSANIDKLVAALVEGGLVGRSREFPSRVTSVGRAMGIPVRFDRKLRALMRALDVLVSGDSLLAELVARLDTELGARELADKQPLAPLFEALAPEVLRLAFYRPTPNVGRIVATEAKAGELASAICSRLVDVALIEKQKVGARPAPSDGEPGKRPRVEPVEPSPIDEDRVQIVTETRNRFIDYDDLEQKTRVDLTMVGPDASEELTGEQLNAFTALGSDIDLRAYVKSTTELTRSIVRWVADGKETKKIDNLVKAYAATNREFVESFDRDFEKARFTFIGILRNHTVALLSSGLFEATLALVDNKTIDLDSLRIIGPDFTYQTFDVFGQLLVEANRRPDSKKALTEFHTNINIRIDDFTEEYDVTYTTSFSDIGDAFFTANRGMDGVIQTFVERLLIVRANDSSVPEWQEYAEKSADEFVAHMVELVRKMGASGANKLARGVADIEAALQPLEKFE